MSIDVNTTFFSPKEFSNEISTGYILTHIYFPYFFCLYLCIVQCNEVGTLNTKEIM